MTKLISVIGLTDVIFCLTKNQFLYYSEITLLLVFALGSVELSDIGLYRYCFLKKLFPSSHFKMDPSTLVKVFEDSSSIVGRDYFFWLAKGSTMLIESMLSLGRG